MTNRQSVTVELVINEFLIIYMYVSVKRIFWKYVHCVINRRNRFWKVSEWSILVELNFIFKFVNLMSSLLSAIFNATSTKFETLNISSVIYCDDVKNRNLQSLDRRSLFMEQLLVVSRNSGGGGGEKQVRCVIYGVETSSSLAAEASDGSLAPLHWRHMSEAAQRQVFVDLAETCSISGSLPATQTWRETPRSLNDRVSWCINIRQLGSKDIRNFSLK